MKKIFLIILMIGTYINAFSIDFQKALNEFSSNQSIKKADIGVSIVDLNTGDVVGTINGNRKMLPASVMKVVTALGTLDAIGPNYSFNTRVVTDGAIDSDSTLNGNLIVIGSGDPSLGSPYFPDSINIVDELKLKLNEIGIKKIKGKIKIDQSLVEGETTSSLWMDEDIPLSYGAGCYALNFMNNSFSMTLDYSSSEVKIAKVEPSFVNIELDNKVTLYPNKSKIKSTPIKLGREKESNVFTVTGKKKKTPYKQTFYCSTPNPASVLQDSIQKGLELQGIFVENKNIKGSNYSELLSFHSPILKDIIKKFLFTSNNMFAESTLRAASFKNFKAASTINGINEVRNSLILRSLNVNDLEMKDGSGLARVNKVTPNFISELLRSAQLIPIDTLYFSELLPRVGVEGTIRNLLKNTEYEGTLALKSGSMRGTQCFAGYFPADNPQFSIAVMVNNFTVSRSSIVDAIETLFKELINECVENNIAIRNQNTEIDEESFSKL